MKTELYTIETFKSNRDYYNAQKKDNLQKYALVIKQSSQLPNFDAREILLVGVEKSKKVGNCVFLSEQKKRACTK